MKLWKKKETKTICLFICVKQKKHVVRFERMSTQSARMSQKKWMTILFMLPPVFLDAQWASFMNRTYGRKLRTLIFMQGSAVINLDMTVRFRQISHQALTS